MCLSAGSTTLDVTHLNWLKKKGACWAASSRERSPFWIPRGFRAVSRSKKNYVEEWERIHYEQSYAHGEDKPHRISRANESAKLQTANEDEWNTTCELIRAEVIVASILRIKRTIMETRRD